MFAFIMNTVMIKGSLNGECTSFNPENGCCACRGGA